MRKLRRRYSAAFFGAACLILTGCSTTTMKLGGTPGATFSGHYRAGDSSLELSGAVPLVVEVSTGSLRECEFRKADIRQTLVLEIRRGKTQILQATAEPGALGVKAQDDDGWKFEIIR